MDNPFMGKHYLVALRGWSELPAPDRIAAEVRFATEFERALGGADAIPDAWAAYMDALEADPGPDDKSVKDCPFMRAQESAAAAAWIGLSKPPSAYFKLETQGDHLANERAHNYLPSR